MDERDGSSSTTSNDITAHGDASAPRDRASKRSSHLTLVFISAAAAAGLAGCGFENDRGTSRDVYANLEECRADWGNPEDCEEIDEKRSSTGSRAFYGPRYTSRTGSTSGYTTSTRPGSRSKGTVTSGGNVSRGGFGASSSRHGSSSSSSSG